MKVYACPDDIPAPEIDFKNYDMKAEQAKEEEHSTKLKKWLTDAGYRGKYTGYIFSMPHADGAARYMFADNGKKSCLIHLPYGDAWDSPNAQFIPREEVIRRIEIDNSRPKLPPMV